MSEILRPLTDRDIDGDADGGFITLPGGIILQWGTVPSIPAGGLVDVFYKKPFPVSAFSLAIGSGSLSPGKPSLTYRIDQNSARFYNTSPTEATGISTFIAIGK